MNYSNLFLWNPVYNLIYKKGFSHQDSFFPDDPNELLILTVLKKIKKIAYPDNPYVK